MPVCFYTWDFNKLNDESKEAVSNILKEYINPLNFETVHEKLPELDLSYFSANGKLFTTLENLEEIGKILKRKPIRKN